jgi:hypothetical protein
MANMTSGSDVSQEQHSSPEQKPDLASKLSQGAGEVADHAVEEVQRTRRRLEDQLAQRRSQLSERLRDVSDVLDSAGVKLGDDDFVADGLHYASSKIERVASYIETSDAQRLAGDLRDAVRERPAWFFGGAFIAGLALARFVKSSAGGSLDADVTRDERERSQRSMQERPTRASGSALTAGSQNAPEAGRGATPSSAATPSGATTRSVPQPPNQRVRQP